MGPRFSIIVPVYNVEAYLAECVDSLLAQDTSEPYEIILVDDGSTDRSGAICDSYAAANEQVRVFHKPNGGVSSARNAGIRSAKGMYVCFCDSDDLYTPDYLSVMSSFLFCQPDMMQICVRMFSEDGPCGDVRPAVFPAEDGETGAEYLKRCLAKGVLPMYGSYYYAIRRTILIEHHLFFREDICVNEDLDFMLRCIPEARCICGVDRVVYLYRQHGASIVHTPSIRKEHMRLETTTEWFRVYPCSALADLVILTATSLPKLGSDKETEELASFCSQNRDIWTYAKDWRARLAAGLFQRLGVYRGSVLFQWLITVKHIFSKP